MIEKFLTRQSSRLAVNAPTRVLIIKTSSLGDVIHNFPMVSDINIKFPACTIDWLVEEAYVPLVKLHPSVHRIIPISLRRWRRSIFSRTTWQEVGSCIHEIKRHSYDLVIDSQGLIKSAVLAKLARGPSCGFGAGYARESLAGMSYDIGIKIDRDQHMLDRCRKLTASALSYQAPEKPNYGLIKNNTTASQSNKALILCSSAQVKKLWPTDRWIEICHYLRSLGFDCQFTWGNQTDRAICEQISSSTGGEIMPKMHLGEIAGLVNQSRLVVGLDTGLLHLAAALEVPLISIFGASDPLKTGPRGDGIIQNCGSKNRFPGADEVKSAIVAVATIFRDE